MSAFSKLSPALFVVAGVAWVGVIIEGSGLLLFWPAAASFLSALAIVVRPGNRTTTPLAGASAFFCLIIVLYQLSVAVSLSGTSLGEVANYSIAVFAGFTVLYLALLYLTLRNPKSAKG